MRVLSFTWSIAASVVLAIGVEPVWASTMSPNGLLVLLEGSQARPVALGAPSALPEGRDAFVQRDPAGLRVETRWRGGPDFRVEIRLCNEGKTPRLLDVGYYVPLQGEDLQWWDGRNIATPGENEMQYMRMLFRLPLSVGLGKERGIAVGLDPGCFVSMFAADARVLPANRGLQVGLRVRLVVDPDAELVLPLSVFAFTPRFAHLDAVQRYYELFPESFNMSSRLRDVMLGGGGYLNSSQAARHLQVEETRRYGQGWEWSYCPAQKPGDWYPDGRFWDEKLGYAGSTDAHQNVVPGTLDDFRRDMRERFHVGWRSAGLAYFLLPYSAEENLLKMFPGSLLLDSKGQTPPPIVGWTKAGCVTRTVYPWGNSYGQELVKEIGEIAEDFQPTAIAFDEAYGCDRQYGPGIEGDPARAWDENGVFMSTQVALGRLGDEIHKLDVRGFRLATVFNKPWSYQTSTRADVAMHEWVPFSNVDSIVSLRLLMGTKPLSWWDGFHPQNILRWENMTPDQIQDGIRAIAAYIRLSSLRYGAFPPTQQSHGVKSLLTLMPILKELLGEGWQPVPAARGENLWIARYGKGPRSFIAVGNPKKSAEESDLTLEPACLSPGTLLFATYEGQPISFERKKGEARLSLGKIEAHGDLIARGLVQIEGAGEVESGMASCSWKPLKQGFIKAQWRGSGGTQAVKVVLPRGATAKTFTLNGVEQKFSIKDDLATCTAELPGAVELELTYEPEVAILCEPGDLAEFPFMEGSFPSCVIAVPPEANSSLRESAQRISAYFEWLKRRESEPTLALMDLVNKTEAQGIPISENPMGRVVQLQIEDKPTSISLGADGRIVLSGRTDADVDRAVLRLLEVLDEKYPFYGALPKSEFYERAGLAGQPLL